MEKAGFFSVTKSKVYITFGFFLISFSFHYVNLLRAGAKWPFFVDLFLSALNFVVILPRKLIVATPSIKGLGKYDLFLFVILIVYWYFFACVLYYAYDSLNRQDLEEKERSNKEERTQIEEHQKEHRTIHKEDVEKNKEEVQAKLFE